MSQRLEKLAILFADICGSTALYDKLGDDLARSMIARCIKTMTDILPAHQGLLIKTIGDEILCAFPTAEASLKAACAMQLAVANDQPLSGASMHIRIGFNYGEVIRESNDVYGNTVNVAARVADITRADQIMATQEAYDALPPDLRRRMRHIMRAEFKGKQELHAIYQVIEKEDDPQSTRIGMPAFRKPPDHTEEMILRYRDHSIKVNRELRTVVLGREETCDILVQNDLASRQHIRIELRFGKFIIADQSTNGTYIRSSNGNVVHITREETVLFGNGSISLGQAFAEHPVELVEFSISSTQLKH